MRQVTVHAALVAATIVVGANTALAQSIPGYTIQEYASPQGAMGITFDPTGIMYVGRDLGHSGGSSADPTYIHRVGIGGSPVVEYGNSMIADPDIVLFDTAGAISGVAGSVLVGGSNSNGTAGSLYAINPDQSVHTLFGPFSSIPNPNELVFDSTGRLLIGEDHGSVWDYNGGAPVLLFTSPAWGSGLALDASDRMYIPGNDGVIRLYDSDGTLIDNAFFSGLATTRPVPIAMGPGGIWGSDLYTVKADTGELLRISTASGTASVIGTGFADSDRITAAIEFGPDNALYFSFLNEDRVIRVIPEPSALTLLAVGCLALLRRRS
ncbi:MAG: hypothetical protein JXO22_05330 [Phycisphaerae bacterium]|nr:hypothetical protein [Phycisphaerae bacterium]